MIRDETPAAVVNDDQEGLSMQKKKVELVGKKITPNTEIDTRNDILRISTEKRKSEVSDETFGRHVGSEPSPVPK